VRAPVHMNGALLIIAVVVAIMCVLYLMRRGRDGW
jgi:hypothetical protein